ncbi:MAG: ABC transporter permease [Candidatus Brachytrichaceae bacterium NZ_4S206]|jgi:ABC-type nitrate/sulfonate/bicarbonate transport system permease component
MERNTEAIRRNRDGILLAAFMTMSALGIWEGAVSMWNVPVYILPAPSRIAQTLFTQPLYFLEALMVTLGQALAGLFVGVVTGVSVAVSASLKPQLERGVMTLAILIKSTPLAAIAPLLTIWLGFGVLPKIIITALLTFFPVLVNALVGLRSAGRELNDLMRIYRASEWQMLIHLRFWLSLPYLFAALRVVAPLSLIGAVIAEWTGASSGLGRVMWLAYSNLNLPPMFAAIFMLSLAGIGIYGVIVWLERRVIRWR